MAISLESISRTKRAVAPPRMVIHGGHGVGKTTFAAGASNPIFLPVEDGLAGLEVDAFPLLETWPDFMSAMTSLVVSEHSFSTAIIDSIDWLERLIWKHVCQIGGKNSIEEFGYGSGYATALNYWAEFLAVCDQLRQRGIAPVLIAHSEIKTFNAPDSESYDRYQIKLHRGASAVVQEWADIIGFAKQEVVLVESDGGFKKTSKAKGTGRRMLQVTESPTAIAKNRYQITDLLPLSWPELVKAIKGE